MRYALHLMKYGKHNGLGKARIDQLFVDFYIEYRNYPFYKKIKSTTESHEVDLSSAGILTFPWDIDRLEGRLIVGRRKDFKWKYDSSNQFVTHIKPFDIYLVTGGNHSIFHGMFFSGGTIQSNETIDYTSILQDFDLTEDCFVNKENEPIEKSFFVKMNPEMEILFLLGKKLIEEPS